MCSEIGEAYYVHSLENSILLKSHLFSKLPIELIQCQKIPVPFYFMKSEKLTLKFIWQYKIPRMSITILKNKNKVGRLTVPNTRFSLRL